MTLDEIRPTYEFDVSCQGSVSQALEAFFEADDFGEAGKPRLPASIALCVECDKFDAGILVQRNHENGWKHENVFRISLDEDPVVDGDVGDLTPDDLAQLKAFVRRNRDLIRAHWDGKVSSTVVNRLKFD